MPLVGEVLIAPVLVPKAANALRSTVVTDRPSCLYHLSSEAFAKIETEEPRLAASFHKFIVNFLSNCLKRREEELRILLKQGYLALTLSLRTLTLSLRKSSRINLIDAKNGAIYDYIESNGTF